MPKPPLVIPSTSRRDLLIGVGAGLAVLAFILFAVMNMGGSVTGNSITGTITAKEFTPAPEDQVTIGKGGVQTRHLDGEYLFKVKAGEKTYNVWVDKRIYDSKRVGDPFVFPRPR